MSGLFLNFIEYELSSSEFSIHALPYQKYNTKEAYMELKANNPKLVFYRQGEFIYYWEREAGVIHNLNGKAAKVSRINHPRIISKMMEMAFVMLMKGIGSYKVVLDSHNHAWELVSPNDALKGQIPGLEIKRRVTFSPYFFTSSEHLRHGFTFAVNLKYRFTWSLSDFKSKGIDNSNLVLAEDATTVIPTVSSLYYFLGATGQQQFFEQQVADLEKPEATLKVITQFFDWFQKRKSEIYLPDGVRVLNFHKKYLPFDRVRPETLYTPQRFFFGGVANTQKLRFYNEMVKVYKPASFGQFEDKTINIGVVFPGEHEGVTEGFLNKLEKSLKEDLHLKRLSFHMVKIASMTLQAYEAGIYQNPELLRSCDLFLIILSQDHERLPPAVSPYFFCKAKLLGDGIPTQDIQVETIKKKVHPLVLSNISLNIYAKLGGTAWTIEKEEKRRDELVIGIGSSKGADGKSILGIAQVFHSDGRYIVGDCAPLSTFDNYAQNLEEYLYQTLLNIITNHINTKETFRLIFHLFKSAGQDNEIRAIENVTNRLKNFRFDFALLHLGYGHNFRLYKNEGRDKIDRGTFIKLDTHTALLHFVPESCLPLKIELDKRSQGFTDLYYLAKQIYWFSSLSHRSYNPSKKTVTIMYPSLMAAMTEKLAGVPNWNYGRLKFVSDKLWFI